MRQKSQEIAQEEKIGFSQQCMMIQRKGYLTFFEGPLRRRPCKKIDDTVWYARVDLLEKDDFGNA